MSNRKVAEADDLVENAIVYVHGRRGIVTHVDFPLIFWIFDDGDEEKHRSYNEMDNLFEVEWDENGVVVADNIEADDDSHSNDNSNDNNVENNIENDISNEVKLNEVELNDVELHEEEEKSEEDKPITKKVPNFLAKNLILPAPKIVSYDNRSYDILECTAKMPQSIVMSKSESTVLDVVNKVSKITLLHCSGVTLSFKSVISQVDLYHCVECLVSCSVSNSLFVFEHCGRCEIDIPSSLDNVNFITLKCEELTIKAVGEDSTVLKEIIITNDMAKETQSSCKWNGSEFVVEDNLDRKGLHGYVTM